MADHRLAHPVAVDGCFGCKVMGVGFGRLKSTLGPDPIQKVPVRADEGRAAGQKIGVHTVHWDGRQDATVRAPTVVMQATTEEKR